MMGAFCQASGSGLGVGVMLTCVCSTGSSVAVDSLATAVGVVEGVGSTASASVRELSTAAVDCVPAQALKKILNSRLIRAGLGPDLVKGCFLDGLTIERLKHPKRLRAVDSDKVVLEWVNMGQSLPL